MRSKKALYNIFSSLVVQVIVVIYGFIVPKIIINNYGSSVNGLISSITQFLSYITLIESGFGPVVKSVLYKPLAKKNNDEINNILYVSEKFFRKIAYIFIIYIILLSVFYPMIVSREFGYIYTITLIIIISISTFAEYFFGMTYKLFLISDQKNYIISIIQIIIYIFSISLTIILAKLNVSIHLLKLILGIVFISRPLMQNYYVKKKYNISFKNVDKKYKLHKKWDGLSQHIASVVHNNTDVAMLTFFSSLSEVSVYSVYFMVVRGIRQLVQSFTGGIEASFGNMIAKKEISNLQKKFGMYEIIFYSIATIFYSTTMVLIVSFISLYTKNVVDANYIRPIFGYLIVMGEFIWTIRLPYSSIVLASGHFKETRKGAWVEAITNIIISLILVQKLGIIGVTLGTIISIGIRTIEFVVHANKYILFRNNIESIKKIILVVIETVIILLIGNVIPLFECSSYIYWGLNGFIIFSLAFLVTMGINYFVYPDAYKELINIFKRIFDVRKKVNNNGKN